MLKGIRLENWSVIYTDSNPYIAPELRTPHFHGIVFGHPNHTDGSEVTTSRLVRYIKKSDVWKTNSGTYYKLGIIDPAYEDAFPNALARLIETNSK